jgi:hypothetical protein
MNSRQKRIGLIGLAAVASLAVFPPWTMRVTNDIDFGSSKKSLGYHFVLLPPSLPASTNSAPWVSREIDYFRATAIGGAIGVLVAVNLWLARRPT